MVPPAVKREGTPYNFRPGTCRREGATMHGVELGELGEGRAFRRSLDSVNTKRRGRIESQKTITHKRDSQLDHRLHADGLRISML